MQKFNVKMKKKVAAASCCFLFNGKKGRREGKRQTESRRKWRANWLTKGKKKCIMADGSDT